jgi:hypothetical protein
MMEAVSISKVSVNFYKTQEEMITMTAEEKNVRGGGVT